MSKMTAEHAIEILGNNTDIGHGVVIEGENTDEIKEAIDFALENLKYSIYKNRVRFDEDSIVSFKTDSSCNINQWVRIETHNSQGELLGASVLNVNYIACVNTVSNTIIFLDGSKFVLDKENIDLILKTIEMEE